MQIAPEEYLGTVLPGLLRGSSLPPPKGETVIQTIVADVDGSEWFYRVSKDDVIVMRGISDQVDLTLSFYSKDLVALAAGELDVKKAVRTSRIKVHGDEEALAWLSRRLQA